MNTLLRRKQSPSLSSLFFSDSLYAASQCMHHPFQKTKQTSFLTFFAFFYSIVIRKYFQWLPHNASFMVIGFAISYVTEQITGIESKERLETMMTFNPNLFSFVLLPLIMFESGYFCFWVSHRYPFLHSFSLDIEALLDNSVSVFIFVGFECICSTILCGSLLYLLPRCFGFETLSLVNAMALAFITMPTEPSTIYPILKRYKISTHFVHFLMGEGMLTELFSIILIRTLVNLEIESDNIMDVIVNFLCTISSTFLGSTLIGITVGMISSVVFKFLPSEDDEDKLFVEVCLFICAPLIAYMLAETCRLSGNISIRLCGIMMAKYTQFNLSPSSYPLCSLKSS